MCLKLLGLLSPSTTKKIHVHVAVPQEEVAKMAEDYRATVIDLEVDESESEATSDN